MLVPETEQKCKGTNPKRLTNVMETNSRSATVENPCLLLNPDVHYILHNMPLLVSILSQFNPGVTFFPYFP
jgi:hypothetical protein